MFSTFISNKKFPYISLLPTVTHPRLYFLYRIVDTLSQFFELSTVLPAIHFWTVGSLSQLLRLWFMTIYLVVTFYIVVLFN